MISLRVGIPLLTSRYELGALTKSSLWSNPISFQLSRNSFACKCDSWNMLSLDAISGSGFGFHNLIFIYGITPLIHCRPCDSPTYCRDERLYTRQDVYHLPRCSSKYHIFLVGTPQLTMDLPPSRHSSTNSNSGRIHG